MKIYSAPHHALVRGAIKRESYKNVLEEREFQFDDFLGERKSLPISTSAASSLLSQQRWRTSSFTRLCGRDRPITLIKQVIVILYCHL